MGKSQFKLNIPTELAEDVRQSALAANRSMTAEIVYRIASPVSSSPSLRDQIAASAVAAMITTHKTIFEADFVPWELYAAEAYKLADAMIVARSKDRSEP